MRTEEAKAVVVMVERLSEREQLVLAYVASGRTDRAIASVLGIAEETVGHHLEHIYEKLSASNRAHAVFLAVVEGYDLHICCNTNVQ